MPAKHAPTDAIAILKADHDMVTKLFDDFERLHKEEADEDAAQVAIQICAELTIHAAVEEEIFYPQVRDAIDDEDLMAEAEVEHATAKDLIAQIKEMDPTDGNYAATVIVLGEYIAHHVKEEQDEMFPKAKKSDLDLKKLGARILERKKELRAEMKPQDEEAVNEAAGANVP